MTVSYQLHNNVMGELVCVIRTSSEDNLQISIPISKGNIDYQEYLKWIANGGDTTGTVPSSVQKDADDWLFNKQLNEYVVASSRLSKYILSEGRVEIKEDVVVGTKQVLNEETGEFETVNITDKQITQTSIEPLDATVDVTTTNMETGAQTTETVKNPLIVEDEEQRAAAQAVVDATPQPVIDSLG
jgi:hypothetical protein